MHLGGTCKFLVTLMHFREDLISKWKIMISHVLFLMIKVVIIYILSIFEEKTEAFRNLFFQAQTICVLNIEYGIFHWEWVLLADN